MTTTPSSIEKQLSEYRLRKQKEVEEKQIMAAAKDVPSTSSSATSTTFQFLHPVYSFVGFMGTKISTSLYSAVAPDHLQRDHRHGRHSLRQTNGAHDAADYADAQPLLPPEDDSDSDDDLNTTDQPQSGIFSRILRTRSKLEWAALGLKVAVWLLLWEIFIIWQFGAVYFLLSGFFFIGYNLRSGPRAHGEVSAYSVFNKDLRRIDGTVSAEQLQREMLFRL
ncbi:putative domain SAYSvFN [Trinorchestia longiramus]|nr:putative domain SAYSvFN [Trinorchestia longiramus]